MPDTDPSEISQITGSPAFIALAIDKSRIYSKIDDLSERLRYLEKQPGFNETIELLQREIDHCEDELVVLSSMMESVDFCRKLN